MLLASASLLSFASVMRWVKNYLSLAGVDSSVFSAHSTRGAASSKAAWIGVPVDAILEAADWSRPSTFSRFYRRDIGRPDVAEAVFNSSQ